ncbi:MAG: DUF3990 domain-containing protein [Lachnospiraceae bacterium]|nr:DUF3990 domain-containing protein [Lachnospiraceae bacterium]
MKNMLVYHASKDIVEYPEVRETRFMKDFSWGFYCTKMKDQASRWAIRGTGRGVINTYSFEPVNDLNILSFEKMNDEWLDFIAKCRAGYVHDYDIVEGPMANDTVWNYVNDFIQGIITREQFWVLAQFKYPTHQISFHNKRAIDCLVYKESEEVYG